MKSMQRAVRLHECLLCDVFGVGRAGDDRGEASGRTLMMGHQRLEGADVTLFCSVDQLGFRPSSTPRPPDRFP